MRKIILILSLLFIGGCLDFGDPWGPPDNGDCSAWGGSDEPADPPYGDYTGNEHFTDSTVSNGEDLHLPFTFSYDPANDNVFFDSDSGNSFAGVMTSELVPAECYGMIWDTNYEFELLITYVSEPNDTYLLNKVVKGIYKIMMYGAVTFAIDWSTNSNYPSGYHWYPETTGYNPDVRDFKFNPL